MDRLEAMSLLLHAIDAGSLSAAGRRLNMPLATLSRKVSELEVHLGVQLLQRSSRRLSLTEAGQSYVEACRRILEDVDAAERAAAGEFLTPTGHLVISAPLVFGRLHVLPIVDDFLIAYPRISVRLELSDKVIDLGGEHIDVAVRIGQLPDSSLKATRVGSSSRVVVAAPSYLATYGTPKRPEDLTRHACISFTALSSPELWRFEQTAAEIDVSIRPRLTVNTAEAATDAAVAGLGLTRVLCYQAAQAIADGKLAVVLRDFEPPKIPVQLVHTAERRLPVKLRSFHDFAVQRLKARLVDVFSIISRQP
eukprot:gene24426-26219_t